MVDLPALKAKDLAAAKSLLLNSEITVVQVAKRLGVAASTGTAICRGHGPRPWEPEPEQPMPIKPELHSSTRSAGCGRRS